MDQSKPFDHNLQIKTKELFGKKAIELLKAKKVPYSQIKEMAIAITGELPLIRNREEFSTFLNNVQEYFPFLNEEVNILKEETKDSKEKDVVEKLEKYINNFSTN